MMPYLSCVPNTLKNFSYFSRSHSMSRESSPLIFFSRFMEMSLISREMFSERSGESTMPRTKRKHSGSRSGHFSMIITPLE